MLLKDNEAKNNCSVMSHVFTLTNTMVIGSCTLGASRYPSSSCCRVVGGLKQRPDSSVGITCASKDEEVIKRLMPAMGLDGSFGGSRATAETRPGLVAKQH